MEKEGLKNKTGKAQNFTIGLASMREVHSTPGVGGWD